AVYCALRADATGTKVVAVSAHTGEGLASWRNAILEAVGWDSSGEGVFIARERHMQALHLASQYLANAATQTSRLELFAEELRLAQHALGAITGEFTADDLLGQI